MDTLKAILVALVFFVLFIGATIGIFWLGYDILMWVIKGVSEAWHAGAS